MFRINCDLCPNNCKGQIGICGNRLENIGKFSAIAIDPIEKKPFYHLYPKSKTLSFGGIGCNLKCPWCQNWNISKEFTNVGTTVLSPQDILLLAKKYEMKTVSFTYNEPTIYYEFIVEAAELLLENKIETLIVSSGYISSKYLEPFYKNVKGANIDLKCFDSSNYKNIIGGKLETILNTLEYLNSSSTWLEITTLIIPEFNDSNTEIKKMCKWIYSTLGSEVPIHFSAFHPSYKYLNKINTPVKKIEEVIKIAKDEGLQYVYSGNI
ncbi:MAG: AmmeMemoRadiSam system radical SAM enzyme [Spirochaetales bacterium]|nr:AmmeMemoRadiSam system radical SAM enzyme [Spirochaetales bacterium]